MYDFSVHKHITMFLATSILGGGKTDEGRSIYKDLLSSFMVIISFSFLKNSVKGVVLASFYR